MLVNRIGDLSLLTAMAFIFILFGTFKYNVIFVLVQYIVDLEYIFLNSFVNVVTLICFLLFIGAMGKSAQIGLHVWLPDAMEGPTPVSALIHAATMVTAGVFLVIRSSFLFEYSANMLIFISFIGGITALFSSIIGTFQFDIKKIVAYSTCSQLGYMFFSTGLSIYTISLFHLFNHAFFKALLFLSMGSIIHGLMDEQDFRKMGSMAFIFPLTYISVLVGSLSLMALPYLTGFYSKDLLLELSFSFFNITSIFIYFMGIFAAFLTAFYSTRLLFWIFLSALNAFKPYVYDAHEPGMFMSFTLIVLCFFSIFAGYVASEAYSGIGSNLWGNSVHMNVSHFSVFDAEFELLFVKLLPLIISILGVILYFIILNNDVYYYLLNNGKFIKIHYFFNKAMLFDYLYNQMLYDYILIGSYFIFYKKLEKGFFEFFGPIFIYRLIFIT
jgi:NADH-ubiquinone oxidoreductase chain 5